VILPDSRLRRLVRSTLVTNSQKRKNLAFSIHPEGLMKPDLLSEIILLGSAELVFVSYSRTSDDVRLPAMSRLALRRQLHPRIESLFSRNPRMMSPESLHRIASDDIPV
jgi:hypothetical protein